MNKKDVKEKNLKFTDKIIEIMSAIFIPIINVLMAAALLKAILMLLVNANILNETGGTYLVLFAVAEGFFYYLPVFLAYTSAKKFKADPVAAMLVALSLLYPGITSLSDGAAVIEIFTIPVKMVPYASSVIPIILSVIMLSVIERPLNKYLPEMIKGFLKPFISLIIVVPLTFLVFGPIGTTIGNVLTAGYEFIYKYNSIGAGVFIGFIWQPMVAFGIQWSMVPIMLNNIAIYGSDSILPMMGPGVFAQAGAALAVSIRTKNKKLKSEAMSCCVTSVLGVTEPTLYKITLPLKRPMLAACIGGAVGGGIIGASNASAISFATPSLISLVAYFGEDFFVFVFGSAIGFIISFVLTLILGFEDQIELEQDDEII